MSGGKRWFWFLGGLVVALFVAGIVWRALTPQPTQPPNDAVQIASRQDGYYLCLNRPPLTPAEMYRLVRRRLPKDDLAAALRGCQQAQHP
jgi:hypothetical protein